MSILEKLAEEGALTPDQLERVSERVQAFLKEANKDPSLKKEAMEKLCGSELMSKSWQRGKDILPGILATSAITALLAGTTDLGKSIVGDLKDNYDKGRAFQNMVESNPTLKDNHSTEALHKAFNTLHTFNPHFARDPWVAGTFVKQTLGMESGADMGSIRALVDANKNIEGTSPRSSIDFFMTAAKDSAKFVGGPGERKSDGSHGSKGKEYSSFPFSRHSKIEPADKAGKERINLANLLKK